MAIFKKRNVSRILQTPHHVDPPAHTDDLGDGRLESQFPKSADPSVLKGRPMGPRRIMVEPIRLRFSDPVLESTGLNATPFPESTPQMTAADVDREIAAYMKESRRAVEQELTTYRNEMMTKTQAECQAMLDKAYRDGFERGKKEGESTFAARSVELVARINEVIATKQSAIEGAREEVLELAIVVAEKIAQTEISLRPEVCMEILKEAVGRITDRDKVVIRVNALDYETVVSGKETLSRHMGDVKNIVIVQDKRIDRGGCIIETRMGDVDSSIETKIETLRKVIQAEYQEEKSERMVSEMPSESVDLTESDAAQEDGEFV